MANRISGGARSKKVAPTKKESGPTIELLLADRVILDVRNTRSHSAEQIEQIKASMIEFGWTVPVLIDEHDVLIAGEGRKIAATGLYEAGHTIKGVPDGLMPCIRMSGLSEAQRRALSIADNKLALNAGWNMDQLRVEIGDLDAAGFDLGVLGFSEWEMTNIRLDHADGETDPNAEWEGMPEYDVEDKTSVRHVIVHFASEADAAAFFERIGQSDTGKTNSIWFPPQENMDTRNRRYE